MVIRHTDSYEYTLQEVDVAEKNLALYGDHRFKADVVKAVRDSIREQVRQRVRRMAENEKTEPTRTVHLSHEMTDRLIDSLRGPAFNLDAPYVVARDDLQAMINFYDEARRQQIIQAE